MAMMVRPDSRFIIVISGSGGERARRHAPKLRAALELRNLPFECVSIAASGDARRLVTQALDCRNSAE